MASTSVLGLALTLLLQLGCARSDFASDRAECATQLVGLATCLPYVQGNARAPTPDCCSGLKGVLAKSPKCLCILVKDRDNPQLNIKINATLALSLPAACSTASNISDCPRLLNLPPNSTEAQVFRQFGTAPSTTTGTSPVGGSSKHASGSGRANFLLGGKGGVERVVGLLLLFVMHLVVFDG